MIRNISAPLAFVIVLAVWAVIYLPGLGTLEIKGEEGRRILPAVTMLRTGNYIVPQVGSEPYFRKPPLVNWLVAGSFKLFGQRNEWAARFPSTVFVLLVAIAFITVARPTLGAIGSLIAALVWMTNFGLIEKGRLIEIEALYISLCGLATICWLSWWEQKRSCWLTWTVPWFFLGLGLLAKGPLHLVFFYAVVIMVLRRAGKLRELLHAAHFAGLAVMLGIFAAWAVPCLQLMRESNVAQTWSRQFSGRLAGEDFLLGGWLMNIPRGFGYFLPWVVALLLVRRERESPVTGASRAGYSGLIWGMALSFIGVSLLPGALSRYTMPLLPAASWLVAVLLLSKSEALPKWLKFPRLQTLPIALRLPAIVTTVACVAMLLYAVALLPQLKKREKVRNIAAQINAVLAPNEPLYAIDPDYQPFLFYVRDPIVYLDHVSEVPKSARYLLVQTNKERLALSSAQWEPLHARTVLRCKDYRGKEVSVLKVGNDA